MKAALENSGIDVLVTMQVWRGGCSRGNEHRHGPRDDGNELFRNIGDDPFSSSTHDPEEIRPDRQHRFRRRPNRLSSLAYYCASKFALAGMSESLAAELRPLGIAVTLAELGPFATDFAKNMKVNAPAAHYDVPHSLGRRQCRLAPPVTIQVQE